MQLKDKVAIVTGAGRGIGKVIALGLAKEGAHIVVNYHQSEAGAEEIKKEIEDLGVRALKIKADVSDRRAVEAMVGGALQAFGRIDILINNAAAKRRVLVADTSEDVWDWIMDTNLKGTFLCSQAVIKTMIAQQSGKIVNITSGRGFAGQAGGAAYSASKAGIIGFTKSLALELAPYEINVNAIAPGRMNTDQWREGRSPEEVAALIAIPRLDVKGVGSADDIMGAVLYLVTEASRYVTGQVLTMKNP